MYCLLSLFTTMFTMIIVVRSMKSVCIPGFVLICRRVSELQGLRLFIVV